MARSSAPYIELDEDKDCAASGIEKDKGIIGSHLDGSSVTHYLMDNGIVSCSERFIPTWRTMALSTARALCTYLTDDEITQLHSTW